MSRNTSNRNTSNRNTQSRNEQIRRPYCKVCHDAGKPESEYNSHFVRSSIGGAICCPTLLNTTCRFCFIKGHTLTKCPVLKEREKEKVKKSFQEKKQKHEILNKSSSIFEHLELSSDDESVPERKTEKICSAEKKEPVEEFPALSTNSIKKEKTHFAISYSSIVSKTKDQYENEEFMKKNLIKKNVTFVNEDAKPKKNDQVVIKRKSWASWSDSDSEDD
jgi:hypothetical protein